MGMLCVPVAAETGDQGYWSFYIIDQISAISDVKLNGQSGGGTGNYLKVYVPDSLDQIEVEFDVTGGPDTNLTITKDYITRLRNGRPDWNPALYAWGGFLTYDVDAGWCYPRPDGRSKWFITSENLRKGGLYHNGMGHMDFLNRIDDRNLHIRYVMS